jgi:hypothetical protein
MGRLVGLSHLNKQREIKSIMHETGMKESMEICQRAVHYLE